MPALLDEKQQAILCYFLPYAERIKKNTEEMSYCFSTFLGSPIEVQRIGRNEARPRHLKSTTVDQWQIGLNSTVGGWGESEADEIIVSISSDDEDHLKGFLSGQAKHQLLEQVLLPAFVDTNMTWQIKLEMKKEQAFIINEKSTTGVGFFKISA